MVRTTVFLPDDMHERLRSAAFRQRMSMAELIRKKLEEPQHTPARSRPSSDPLLSVAGICSGEPMSSDIDADLYG